MNQTVLEAKTRGSDVIDVLSAVLHPRLNESEQESLDAGYAVMAREEGLYEGEKGARRIVRELGVDPDELRMQLRAWA